MMEMLVFVITGAFETAISFYYYDSFMYFKWNKTKKILLFISVVIATELNAVLFEIIPTEYYSIKLLTYIAIHIFFVKLCYKSTWVMSIFFAGSAILLQILVQTIVYVPLQLSHNENQIIVNLMACLACVLSLLIEIFLRRKLPKLKEYLTKEYALLKSFIWLPFVTMLMALFSYVFFISPSDMMIFQMVVSFVLLVLNILSLFLLQDSLIKDEKLRLSEMQIESKQNQLQAFRSQKSLYERQGKKLHDYKKQLTTLQELLRTGDTKTALEFTEQLTKSIDIEMSEVGVGHPVVNAILNQYYRIAKSEDIGMTFAISDMHTIRLSDDDIVILMGNLLENAISECKKLKELNRPASIQIKLVEKESQFAEKNSQLPEKDSQFVFTVCNPVVRKVKITDNKVGVVNNKAKITDNKIQNVSWNGHGIGLSNVSEVVEKYDGSFAISCDEKEFTAVVII